MLRSLRREIDIFLTIFIVAAMSINGLSQQHRPARTEINEARLRSHIKFLSDDALEGRGTGARGGNRKGGVTPTPRGRGRAGVPLAHGPVHWRAA